MQKQIGQGGMGAVYIATDERFGSTVAIKETLFMDDNYRKAIEREARLLNSLKHPALPRVSDHFLEENVQFLVMEYIPGEDLSHMLESGVLFEVDRVLKWADQLLDALDFLHSQSIPVIHRDIKPQNLKLTARDQIILLDFGLAKGNPTDAGHQTAAKSIFGYSRNYASLEQIQGTGTDPRSDLYSLAATLYHLLTGEPPEDALTRAMAVLSSRPDPLRPADSIRAEIPPGVSGILRKALSLSADDRPASAAEMRGMFKNYEDLAYLNRSATTVAEGFGTEAGVRNTRLMPSDTQREVAGQTDVKTVLMPKQISQETSVRPLRDTNGFDSSNRRGRRGTMIAAALAAVIIACGSAAGLYLYDPSIFGEVTDTPARSAVPEPASAANTSNESVSAEPTDVDPLPTVNEPVKDNVPGKVEVVKNPKATPEKGVSVPQTPEVRVEGDNVYIGNVKVGPNGIDPNVWIDPNGIKRPLPPPTNAYPFPGITREQFDQMTPRQRQRLIEARRQLLLLQRRQPPTPQTHATPQP